MDFLDIIAAVIIGVVVFIGFYLYDQFYLSDILIKWKGVQTTAVVMDSTTARTRLSTFDHSQRYAHYITYEFADTTGKK